MCHKSVWITYRQDIDSGTIKITNVRLRTLIKSCLVWLPDGGEALNVSKLPTLKKKRELKDTDTVLLGS